VSRIAHALPLVALGAPLGCGDVAGGPPFVGRIIVWVLLGVAMILALLGAFGRYR
jgi:hypothetical protein